MVKQNNGFVKFLCVEKIRRIPYVVAKGLVVVLDDLLLGGDELTLTNADYSIIVVSFKRYFAFS